MIAIFVELDVKGWTWRVGRGGTTKHARVYRSSHESSALMEFYDAKFQPSSLSRQNLRDTVAFARAETPRSDTIRRDATQPADVPSTP